MKNLVIILGGLVAAALFLIVIILNQPAQNLESKATPPGEPAQVANNPVTLPPTIHAQNLSDALPTPLVTVQPPRIVIPPQTVNGYTAAIESAYADTSHISFQVRITGGEITFGDEHFYDRIGSPDLYDETGALINTSGGWGPALDPVLYQFDFVPVTLIKGDRLKGQFSFDLNNAPEYEKILAQFRFDFDLPINPDVRFNPKQVVAANGLEILLDSITVTPTLTHIYLCFSPPSFADWNIASQSVLQLDGQEANPIFSSVLFDSAIGGDRTAGSEPYWNPPTKNGRCVKSGFPLGSSNPSSLTLTIPQLEKLAPDMLVSNQFSVDYPGLSEKQAYAKYLEEHGNITKGPWVFTVELKP